MIDIIKNTLRPKQWIKRISLAKRAGDCKDIPKVENAGKLAKYNGADVQVMHNGVRIFAGCYHGSPMTKIIKILKGHHEPQEERVFYEVLKTLPSDAVMLEVGSYWAYYSLWFSHEQPNRKNYLIEPVNWKRKVGELNFSLNNKAIEIDQYYIENPEISLEESTGSSSDNLQKANAISIDEYMKFKKIDKIDILHADIQGAEVSMLKGAERALSKSKIDYIFLSTHFDKHQECVNILSEHNYTIVTQHLPDQSFSADGLIVAAGKFAKFKDRLNVEYA